MIYTDYFTAGKYLNLSGAYIQISNSLKYSKSVKNFHSKSDKWEGNIYLELKFLRDWGFCHTINQLICLKSHFTKASKQSHRYSQSGPFAIKKPKFDYAVQPQPWLTTYDFYCIWLESSLTEIIYKCSPQCCIIFNYSVFLIEARRYVFLNANVLVRNLIEFVRLLLRWLKSHYSDAIDTTQLVY